MPANFILLISLILFCEKYYFHRPASCSSFSSDILLSILFLTVLSLCSVCPKGERSWSTPSLRRVFVLLFKFHWRCPQTGPCRLFEDVNEMLRASLCPRDTVPAVRLQPGEFRGSSGRVLTSTGLSSYLRNHAMSQQQRSKPRPCIRCGENCILIGFHRIWTAPLNKKSGFEKGAREISQRDAWNVFPIF
jgi:hypothetical protein